MRADRPTKNFGGASKLSVDSSPIQHILLRFTVSGVGTDPVQSATLRLRNVNASDVGGSFYRVADSSWGERTVTWNTAPGADSTPLASLGAVALNTWYSVDLTSLVTGDGTYSILVASTSADGADYVSKEGTSGFGPQLVVVTAPPADTSPPTVSITSPSPGQVVSGTTTVDVAASDPSGVAKVELLVDGSLRGTALSSPYSFQWDTTVDPDGAHDLVARAYDGPGNVGDSSTVTVTVSNGADTGPPSAPTGVTATSVTANRVDLSWTASTDDRGVTGYSVLRDGVEIGTTTATSFSDGGVAPATSYTYAVTAHDAAGHTSASSDPITVTTPAAPSSFSFAAAGDHGANPHTDASLAALDRSGVNFYLALGDLDYDETATDAAWCDYVKARLPTLGPTFPFELVSGNHEEQGGSSGYILNHAACLPDRMGSTLGPTGHYGAEYYFDYPPGNPLARVIMLAPNLTIENVLLDYRKGTIGYVWVSNAIDAARTAGIPWVIVGMHYPCLSEGKYGCSMGRDLMNLLIEKKVDLVLQGHDHNFQRGKQLALDASTCPAVVPGSYSPSCVVDDGSDAVYPRGAGTVFLIDGTFGQGFYPINPDDTEAPYFIKADASTWGFMKYMVTSTRIDASFVNGSGSFTDGFSIEAGAVPRADTSPPTAPTGLMAVPRSSTQVDLSWNPSSDDGPSLLYAVYRDGSRIGTTASNAFTDTAAAPGTTQSYTVRAFDAVGNPSLMSAAVSVTTPPAQNQPPTVNAGPDQSVILPNPANLSGTATDDGLPNPPGTLTTTWSMVSGPGTVTFGNPSALSTTASFSDPGTYVLRLTADDSALQASDDLTVSVASASANLVGNPGFETTTTGWNTSGSDVGVTLSRVSGGHSGGWSGLVANGGTGVAATCKMQDAPNWVTTTSAATYTGSMWVRSDTAGATFTLKLREFNGSALVVAKTKSITLSTSWQLVTVTDLPTMPGTSTLDFMGIVLNAPVGTCFYADDMSIVLS